MTSIENLTEHIFTDHIDTNSSHRTQNQILKRAAFATLMSTLAFLGGCQDEIYDPHPTLTASASSEASANTIIPTQTAESNQESISEQDMLLGEQKLANYQLKPEFDLFDFRPGNDRGFAEEYMNAKNNIELVYVNFSATSKSDIEKFSVSASSQVSESTYDEFKVTDIKVFDASPLAKAIYNRHNPGNTVDIVYENVNTIFFDVNRNQCDEL